MFSLDVSIIIVNYNTKELIRNCLKSVFEQTKDIAFEVIVSDNGSTDGSVEMIKAEFPQVILIENNANLGFGAANNRGLKIAKGKYIFYLNSDTILLNNAIKIFFDYWENSPEKEKIGALGANLLDKDGKITHSWEMFPTYKYEIKRLIKTNIAISVNELFAIFKIPYPHKKKQPASKFIGEVDYITGADLFKKNDESAEFDEKYFLYFEETDLQWRLFRQGLKRCIIDGPKIVHLEGKSNNAKKQSIFRYISFSAQQILISRLIYFKKNNCNSFYLLLMYVLTNLVLLHIPFFIKTIETRKKIKRVFYGSV